MKLTQSNNLEVRNKSLFVDGKPFVVEKPNEELYAIEEGELVTMFRGHLFNFWEPEQIEGYFA